MSINNTISPELEKQIEQEAIEIETWSDIVGYEGIYKVSSYGSVLSLERVINARKLKCRVLKQPLVKGYPAVNLYKDGVSKLIKVHKLVATAFLLNPDNKPEVNHKDRNRTNNRISNLEWVTSAENMTHFIETGGFKSTNKRTEWSQKFGELKKKSGRKVKCHEDDLVFDSIQNAAAYYCVPSKQFGDMIRGKRKNTTGKSFSFIDDYKGTVLNQIRKRQLSNREIFNSIVELCEETIYPRQALNRIKRYCDAASKHPFKKKDTADILAINRVIEQMEKMAKALEGIRDMKIPMSETEFRQYVAFAQADAIKALADYNTYKNGKDD